MKMSKSWVDGLTMEPVMAGTNLRQPIQVNDGQSSVTFNVGTFNILAEAYLTPRSHKNLPDHSAKIVFDPPKRRALLCETLKKLVKVHKFDILCLQELDAALKDIVIDCLATQMGYGYVYAPRGGTPIASSDVNVNVVGSARIEKSSHTESLDSSNNTKKKSDRSNVRSDGCATFFLRSKWRCVDYEVVSFDDLADENRQLLINDDSTLSENDNTISTSSTTNPSLSASPSSSIPVTANSGSKHPPTTEKSSTKPIRNTKKRRKHQSLTGIMNSYRRSNAALIVKLKHTEKFPSNHNRKIEKIENLAVANAHLYWHPGYEYVKLSQAHYLLHRLKRFAGTDNPVIVCGDMNSKPGSTVHKYLTQGRIDARTVAPWNFYFDEALEEEQIAAHIKKLSIGTTGEKSINDPSDDVEDQDPIVLDEDDNVLEKIDGDKDDITKDTSEDYLVGDLIPSTTENDAGFKKKVGTNTTIRPEYGTSGDVEGSERKSDSKRHEIPRVKYLCDFTLNKFTRWLRILGLDAVLETDEEEKLRTGEGSTILFQRSLKEKRILITTSKTLLLRKDCPPGTFLVNPSTIQELEATLVRLLLLHGVTLYPKKFLTRCVVCNGNILEVNDPREQARIFDEYGSPNLSDELDHVYQCDNCGQGYWWSSEPSSSASRVKDAATHLLRLCLRGGVQIEGQPDFFHHVDYDTERRLGEETRKNSTGEYREGNEEVLQWLKDDNLCSPFSLKSAYAEVGSSAVGGLELLPFTNVTSDFVGALDYILFADKHMKQLGRMSIPTSFVSLNSSKTTNGHLLPSANWPSDHLSIGAMFSLKCQVGEEEVKVVTTRTSTRTRTRTRTRTTGIPSAYVPPTSTTSGPSTYVFPTNTSIPSAYVPPGLPSTYVPPGIPSAYVPVVENGIHVDKTKSQSASASSNNNEKPKKEEEEEEEHLEPHPGCDCGCVPKVLSLFQMAELRKRARLKAMAARENK